MPEPAGQKEKVLVFIDVGNLNAAQNELKISIDFRAFLEVLRNQGEFIEKGLRFYEQDAVGKQGFFSALRAHGYTIIPTKESNVDDAILRDIYLMANLADRIVLVSGDEDFVDALLIAGAGKKLQVFSISTMVAARFRNKPFEYIDLADLVDQIIDKTKTNKRSRRIDLGPSSSALEVMLGNVTIVVTPNKTSANVRISGSETTSQTLRGSKYITIKNVNWSHKSNSS